MSGLAARNRFGKGALNAPERLMRKEFAPSGLGLLMAAVLAGGCTARGPLAASSSPARSRQTHSAGPSVLPSPSPLPFPSALPTQSPSSQPGSTPSPSSSPIRIGPDTATTP